MKTPSATAKCFLNAERTKLVAEGDASARYLFANSGECVPSSRLEGLENAGEFFADLPISEDAEHPEDHIKSKRRTRD